MSVVVFAGPTIDRQSASQHVAATVRGPAARGDVLRAALDRPSVIVLIDGYFDRVPAVWHKEILWAMAQGVHVVGAASMGALRAAELCAFGMEGVGQIFEAYRDGELEDDDEVTIAHGEAEYGYRAVSTALVNVRATLRAASDAGVLEVDTCAALLTALKRMHYSERTYEALCAICAKVSAAREDPLRLFLSSQKVDQKRLDAIAALERARALAECGMPKRLDTNVSETFPWLALLRQTQAEHGRTRAGLGAVTQDALNGALVRALAIEAARLAGVKPNDSAIGDCAERFRRERGLLSEADFASWCERQGLRGSDVERFFAREWLVRQAISGLTTELDDHLADYERATPTEPASQRRSRDG